MKYWQTTQVGHMESYTKGKTVEMQEGKGNAGRVKK
jgi:hypothetical protein